MKKKKDSSKVLLWIACILSFIAVIFNLLTIFVITFDLFGLLDIVEAMMNDLGYTLVGSDMSLVCLELAVVVLIDVFAGLRYIKIIKNRINVVRFGGNLMMQTVLQILFGSFLAGIFGCIAISIMSRRKPMPVTEEDKVQYINDFKKKAMGEAITRLKELKAQGAISEEEYYETLNKILEG